MRNRSILLVAVFATARAMSAGVGTASAGRLSLSNARFRLVWSPLGLTLAHLKCELPLEGSSTPRLSGEGRRVHGYISRAIVSPPVQCTHGEVTVVQEGLPWHIR